MAHPPEYRATAFDCPHCGAYAHQTWSLAGITGVAYRRENAIRYEGTIHQQFTISRCERCTMPTIWLERDGGPLRPPVYSIAYPHPSSAPRPSEDMPADARADFEEARQVLSSSPRAAAALLRLALQRLMPALGQTSGNLDRDIAALVRDGLPTRVQQALDSVRVIGNHAVHPGQIDLDDDADTAPRLFELVNFVVEKMITEAKQIDAMYKKIPESTRAAIKKRDGNGK